MINYIFLFFLPGGAGHFVARALNLVSDHHHGLATSKDTIFLNLDQRSEMLGYGTAHDCSNWNEFERQTRHYSHFIPYHSLPDKSYSIWLSHPTYNLLEQDIVGQDDCEFRFYIDPGDELEWCLLNALYKDAHISRKWLATGQDMMNDPGIHKISLGNIIRDCDSFCNEMLYICSLTGKMPESHNLDMIRNLWYQWTDTTLKHSQFDEFKRSLGWKLK